MSKSVQFLVALVLSGVLCTATSFAGPGGNGPKTSGDPDIPTSTIRTPEEQYSPMSAANALESSGSNASTRVMSRSGWSQVIRLYVRWSKVFVR